MHIVIVTEAFFIVLLACQSGGATVGKGPSGISKRGTENCPIMDRVQYYQSRLVAVAEVTNAIVDPSFTLTPDDELVRSVCPQCLSSVKGELHVNFGQLTQEMGTTKNITIRMSWGLRHSWEKICGGGGLTWLYSTNANWLSIVERPELVEVVIQSDPGNVTSSIPNNSGSNTHIRALPMISALAAIVLSITLYHFSL